MLWACGGKKGSADSMKMADSMEAKVKQVCSRCHEWIPADMLDKTTWRESVLPVMAAKMGIYEMDGKSFYNERNDPNSAGVYPETPQIDMETLRDIFNYFEAKAPEVLPAQKREQPIGAEKSLFSVEIPQIPAESGNITTFVDIRPAQKQIIAGVSGSNHAIRLFDKQLKPLSALTLPSAPSWVDVQDANHFWVTCMGNILPNNAKEGQLIEVQLENNRLKAGKKLLELLPRPVQIQKANLTSPGDILVNGFGHLRGRLYFHQNGTEKTTTLRDMPGCLHSKVLDWDKDGKNDVIAMFTQGKEAIVLFRNLGNGQFEEKELLSFLPVNGSSWFEIVDVNADGLNDIVYTCGDNADYSVVLKPYHGIYVYENKGQNEFSQTWFYPVHGAYRVMLRDFDLDKDLDMVSIAYFADFTGQPEETLLYFENQGKMNWKPFRLPGALNGRWLTMDAGDVDGDGDEDIVLGNFSQGPQSFISQELVNKFTAAPPFTLLRNRTR
jgi:hypothetical protein